MSSIRILFAVTAAVMLFSPSIFAQEPTGTCEIKLHGWKVYQLPLSWGNGEVSSKPFQVNGIGECLAKVAESTKKLGTLVYTGATFGNGDHYIQQQIKVSAIRYEYSDSSVEADGEISSN